MKKLIFSAAMLTFATLATQASTNLSTTNYSVQDTVPKDSTVKTIIKLEELPEAVKTALTAEPYKGWMPTAATHVKGASSEFYQIDVKKEDEVKTVKLDKEGKPVQ